MHACAMQRRADCIEKDYAVFIGGGTLIKQRPRHDLAYAVKINGDVQIRA